jgi:hypothetical protein
MVDRAAIYFNQCELVHSPRPAISYLAHSLFLAIEFMSRAFVNEDAGTGGPVKHFGLPPRDDPGFDAAAAEVLLEAAREGDTSSAEQATGYYWGEPKLREHVRRILARAMSTGDDRLEQLARRFLR